MRNNSRTHVLCVVCSGAPARGDEAGETAEEASFYSATVLSYHNKTEKYEVLYDSGEKEHVRLDGPGAPEHRWLTAPTTKPGEVSVAVKRAEAEAKAKAKGKNGSGSGAKGKKRKRADGPKRARKPDPRRVKAREERAAREAAAAAAAQTAPL